MLTTRITRRELLKGSLATLAAAPFLGSAAVSLADDKPAKKPEPFKLCILVEPYKAGRDPFKIAPGWDAAEIPCTPIIKPFSDEAEWKETKATIASWKLPPFKAATHCNEGILPLLGPKVDVERQQDWVKRSCARLAEIGVEVAGLWGSHFKVPEGFSKEKAIEQALRYVEMFGKAAKQHKIFVALEPTADPDSLFPKYVEGVAFAKRIGMPEVRCMADIAYFVKGNQDVADIAKDPDYCVHCQVTGDKSQPREGDRTELFLKMFGVLRDIGYTRVVSAACPWVSTTGGEMDFRVETGKSLAYLQRLRTKTYEEAKN